MSSSNAIHFYTNESRFILLFSRMCEAKNTKKYEAITVQRCYLFSLKEILSVNIIFKISHWLQANIMKKTE